MFDAAQATAFVEAGDRDVALYFSGRDREIRAFHDCLERVRVGAKVGLPPRSMIRIYQGAPGCGKTSLINQLVFTNTSVLFFRMTAYSFNNAERFVEKAIAEIQRAIHRQAIGLDQTKLDALAKVRLNEASDVLSRLFVGSTHVPPIVICVDEAQIFEMKHGRCLSDICSGGTGLPVMVLLAGLTHTQAAVTSIPGFSDLPRDSVINMGDLSDEECKESTLMLLTDIDAHGDSGEIESVAERSGSLAYGWPQHLNCAQTALCNELLRAGGELRKIDFPRVVEETTTMREEYYADRIWGTMLLHEFRLTAAVALTLSKMPKVDFSQLEDLCAKCLATPDLVARRHVNYGPGTIAQELIRRGVIALNDEGSYEPSIPSMVTWLRERTELPKDFSIAT